MNKSEAITALKQGKTLTHAYFSESEWVKLNERWDYEFEDGCTIDETTFWKDRPGKSFEEGWELFIHTQEEVLKDRNGKEIKAGMKIFKVDDWRKQKVVVYEKDGVLMAGDIKVSTYHPSTMEIWDEQQVSQEDGKECNPKTSIQGI